MSESQLDTHEPVEPAAPDSQPTPPQRQFVIVGSVVGALLPCLFALVFNERSWQEYADYYGPGYHRLVGLLTEFPVPMFLGGIAGAVAGYFLFLAIYSNRGFQSRTLAGGVVAGAVVANMIAMAVYSSELFASRSRGEPAYADDVLRGVIWLIMHPTPHGAWMGAILAWAIASAFARQRVGPKTGAIGSSIFAAVLSTIAMVVIMSLTAPPGNYHGGTGMGPRESHGLIFIFIHLVFVLPISMIVGAVLGWRTHQGPR